MPPSISATPRGGLRNKVPEAVRPFISSAAGEVAAVSERDGEVPLAEATRLPAVGV
jgi:hypothetical protein